MLHTVSKSGFGLLIGVVPSRVTRLIERGLPTCAGRIDPEAAARWVLDNVDETREGCRAVAGARRYLAALHRTEFSAAEVTALRRALIG